MSQLNLFWPEQPTRFEIGGAWCSTVNGREWWGPRCVDCTWPVFESVRYLHEQAANERR